MSEIPSDLRQQLLAAIDAPMTDLEAVQTVVAMFEVLGARMKIAPKIEQAEIAPLVIRADHLIDHLCARLGVAG